MTKDSKDNFYKDGYQLALDNARRLFKIAQKASDEGEFGIACSLNILAAEESIKAIFLFTKHNNKDAEIDDFDKIFRDHKTKHKHLLDIVGINSKYIEILYSDTKLFDYLLDIVETVPEPHRSEIKLKFRELYEDVEWIERQKKNKLDIQETNTWLQNANNEKNRGFYVDKDEQKWYAPKDFTFDQFEKEKQHTVSLIENAQRIIQIVEESKV